MGTRRGDEVKLSPGGLQVLGLENRGDREAKAAFICRSACNLFNLVELFLKSRVEATGMDERDRMEVYSLRTTPKPDVYEYDITQKARNRILFTMKDLIDRMFGTSMFDELESLLLRQYGSISVFENSFASHPIPAVEHALSCPDENFLDFLELSFHIGHGGCGATFVDQVNTIFEEENIGYELTPFVRNLIPATQSPRPVRDQRSSNLPSIGQPFYGPCYTTGVYEEKIQHPVVIKKSDKVLHKETIQPCLHALLDSRFTVANGELLKAFEEYRKGDYPDTTTDAGSAFETTMKTICDLKSWRYNIEKDTCSPLVDALLRNGLIDSFYGDSMKGIGRIRNKLGDAHGKGPKPRASAHSEQDTQDGKACAM